MLNISLNNARHPNYKNVHEFITITIIKLLHYYNTIITIITLLQLLQLLQLQLQLQKSTNYKNVQKCTNYNKNIQVEKSMRTMQQKLYSVILKHEMNRK